MRKLDDVPKSLEAESACVACCIWANASVPLLFEICTLTDFIDPYMSSFISAIKAVWDDDAPVDVVTVEQRLRDTGQFSEEAERIWRGITNGSNLVCLPTAANVEWYAKIVREKRIERDLINAIDGLSKNIMDKSLKVQEKKELFEQAVLSLNLEAENNEQSVSVIAQRIWDSMFSDNGEPDLVVQTGYEQIDEQIGGLGPGEVCIIAARPSNGKSTMLQEIALSISTRTPVLILSMEMNQESIVYRMLSFLSRIPVLNIKANDLSTEQEKRLSNAKDMLSQYKIYIDESAMLSPAALSAKVMKARAVYGIGCAMVDYMQLMHIPRWRSDNRVQEITRISSEIRAIAKRAKIPIIVASQMSRAIESRADGEPRLSDLRESGAIEQDADYVMFLYPYQDDISQKGYESFQPGANDPRQHCLKIAKSRQGRKDVKINLYWRPAYYTFKRDAEDDEITPF